MSLLAQSLVVLPLSDTTQIINLALALLKTLDQFEHNEPAHSHVGSDKQNVEDWWALHGASIRHRRLGGGLIDFGPTGFLAQALTDRFVSALSALAWLVGLGLWQVLFAGFGH